MIRKVHGTDFKEMKAGLIMKYWNFTRRILLTLFFTTAVCPGLSQAVLHVNAASDDCSVTIGDGETSFSLDHAVVDAEDGHVTVTLSPEDYAELSSAFASTSKDTEDSNPEAHTPADPVTLDQADGTYSIELTMTGGSGKASVVSPTILTVENGQAYADITWSSSNYDYMIVAGNTYLNESDEGMASKFHIPITKMDEEMAVIADTTAMGTPHEVNYVFTFYSESIGSTGQMPQEAAKRVVFMAVMIIIVGGILNRHVNKKKKN